MAELYSPPAVVRRTIVVVTASNDKQAAAVEKELAARRKSGAFGPDVLLFAVPDPSSARVGSGGATFNALVTVQELVSAYTDIKGCLVICIHSGGDSQRMYTQSVCGKAWSSLPSLTSAGGELDAPIDLLLTCLLRMFANVPSGLVVASSDVLLLIPESYYPDPRHPERPSLWKSDGATGLAIPTTKAVGPNHGVYHCAAPTTAASPVARVSKFFQKASVQEMAEAGAVRGDDTVLIDTGVIYFSPDTTSQLLDLARTDPLDSCTYAGLDCGLPALRIELYSDIMMAMDKGLGLSEEAYHQVASSESRAGQLREARSLMWKALNAAPFYAAVIEGGDFAHVGTTLEYLQLLTAPTPVQEGYRLQRRAAWYAEGAPVAGLAGCLETPATTPGAPLGSSCVQNSLFASPGRLLPGSVVEHSVLRGHWAIGAGCLVSSVRTFAGLVVRDGIAVQELGMAGGGRCVTVLGCRDPIKDPFTKASARVCGVPWDTLFAAMAASGGLPLTAAAAAAGAAGAAGAAARDTIWGKGVWERSPEACTLWTARLWPVTSGASLRSGGVAGARGGSSESLVDTLRLGGYGDPINPDKVALWLQWLGEGGSGSTASSSADSELRAEHLDGAVVRAWLNAPRLCLRDILGEAEAGQEFAWRRSLRGNIDCALLVSSIAQDSSHSCADLVRRVGHSATPSTTLLEGAAGTASVLESSSSSSTTTTTATPAEDSFAHTALHRLDAIAASAPPNIAGRALAVQSALLWAMAGWGLHGHRSGPAYNAQWLPALNLLDGDEHAGGRGREPGSRAAAIQQLAALRRAWCSRAHLTGRAARHYERAAQLLTAQCVYTAPVAHPVLVGVEEGEGEGEGAQGESQGGGAASSSGSARDMPAVGAWMYASAPVRIDLAGGWSDTPPITYEAHSLAAAVGGGATPCPPPTPGTPLSPAAAAAAGGGLVVNAGVLLDGMRCLGARVRRVALSSAAQPLIVVRTRGLRSSSSPVCRGGASGSSEGGALSPSALSAAVEAAAQGHREEFEQMYSSGGAPGEVVLEDCNLHSLGDLADYNKPHARGALVKCALLCMRMLRLPPPGAQSAGGAAAAGAAGASTPFPTLQQQLQRLCGCGTGLEVETWSLVPMGSGLGTSSILAGTVLAALAAALGVPYSRSSLCHLVLIVEQMLTTGGGWQDQVGGLWPGVKASWCASALPVAVRVFPLSPALQGLGHEEATAALTPAAVCDSLDSRLFLLYTGRTRLAKHLLQRVLRQWAVRENGITRTVESLRGTAAAMAGALAGGDMEAAGAALNAYWAQKKDMAPLAEPPDVSLMLKALEPHILGASLCGAGGGGFLVGIARVAAPWPQRKATLSAALEACQGLSEEAAAAWQLHMCTIDKEGLAYHRQ